MPKTFSARDFLDALVHGDLSAPVVQTGIVKSDEKDPDVILFSEDRVCDRWIRIPLNMVEQVEYLAMVGCRDHEHPFVHLHLKPPPGNTAAALFATLLSRTSGIENRVSGDKGSEELAVTQLSATQRIEIAFQANGDGTMYCHGLGTFNCQGRPGVRYPLDLTVTEAEKEINHWSQEFQVWMPYAIRIWPQRGIYIHKWGFCRASGGQSAGCIHLCAGDAESVYNWITGRTRVTISYPW